MKMTIAEHENLSISWEPRIVYQFKVLEKVTKAEEIPGTRILAQSPSLTKHLLSFFPEEIARKAEWKVLGWKCRQALKNPKNGRLTF